MAEKKEKEKKEKVKGKGGSLFKIIIIVLLLLIVLAIGFVGYLLATKKIPLVINQTTQTDTTKKITSPTIYNYKLDEFLLNLADSDKKYLKVKLSLGYEAKDKKKMDKELEDKKDNVRDAIISVLRSKKSTDLDGLTGIDQLKKDIITRVNGFFDYGKVDEIYINDILIQ